MIVVYNKIHKSDCKCAACKGQRINGQPNPNHPKWKDGRTCDKKAYDKNRYEKLERENRLENYGITSIEYNKILKKQNGVCAICGKSESLKIKNTTKRRLTIDHEHKTGKIRGLLCTKCNLGIGNFLDDINIMEKAIKYLIK